MGLVVACALPAAAQEPSTTTVTDPSTPTTTVPVTPGPSVPDTTIPPEIVNDPRAPIFIDPGPGDGGDPPAVQPRYNPGSRAVIPARVGAAESRLTAARTALTATQAELSAVKERLSGLRVRLGKLGADRRRRISQVNAARRQLRDHTVSAYMSGRPGNALTLVGTSDPVQLGIAHRYLSTVVAGDDLDLRRYEAARRRLDKSSKELSDQIASAESDSERLNAQLKAAVLALSSASKELTAYSSGAQFYVDGFVFPVAGPVEFVDTWGAARMSGTSYAHWHQGTDIFAPLGAPLVASEDGFLARVGTGTLGGNKLWVVGASGTEYYYAHLSAFSPGVRDGMPVRAGQVVGYVGNTGNAVGTPFHCHFEIHPGGGDATNPYPMLKAAYVSKGPVTPVFAAPVVPVPAFGPVAPTTLPGG